MPPAGAPPAPKEEDTTPANFQLGQLFVEGIKVKLAEHPETKFDENEFLMLLASSISLSKAEKKRIIEAIPKLKQWQVDELMNIFKEEKQKFAQLSKKHVPQLEKLAKQHFEEWRDIEVGEEQATASTEDAAKADEIRKNLGL
jgi:primosomal protein N'